MRIAHIGSKGIPSRGGTERVVEALSRRQARRHSVTVYGSRRVCSTGRVDGVDVVARHTLGSKHLGPMLLQLSCVVHALVRDRFDVVHLHGSENGFVVPLLRWRYPVVSTSHGPAYMREKWSGIAKALIRAVEGLSVKRASVATSVAASQARSLSERYGVPVRHVPNGIESVEGLDGEAARSVLESLGIDGAYWLFAAARVDPTKGCHTLLEAYAGVSDAPPLVVVGDLWHAPGYEEALRRMAEGLKVSFVPRMDEKAELMGLLRGSALFVFPSTVEAMSMMLLEALALGVPVLASDIDENLDVLPEGAATFRAGDAASLRGKLEKALSWDPAESRASAAAWAEETRVRHDWDRISRQYEAIYQELA